MTTIDGVIDIIIFAFRIEQELSSPAVDFAMLIEQVDQMFEEEDKFDRLKVYQFLMQYYDDVSNARANVDEYHPAD